MKIECLLCGKMMKTRINGSHLLRSHNTTLDQYREKFPNQDIGTRNPNNRTIVSVIDGRKRRLSDHTKHCKENNLSSEGYYNKYITRIKTNCQCGCGEKTSFINVIDGYNVFTTGHGSNDKESSSVATKETTTELCKNNEENFTKKFKSIHKTQWENDIKNINGRNESEKIYKYFYPDSGGCEICGNKSCHYRSFIVGYWATCGHKCALIKESREKYGVDNKFQSESIKKKSINTMRKKYGVDSPCEMHVRWKEYKMPSGRIVKFQGYENFALDKLIASGINENEILIEKKTQPKIFYLYNGKKCRYYMDLYIKNINKIVEVKSDWTYKIHKNRNIAKKEECIRRGFDFEFWVFNNKKELTIL